MESVLGILEGFFNLSWLVSVGDFYAAKCADVGGDWVRLADNAYECVNTDLDRWVEGLISNR
jgi:hypothetical protein